MSATKASAASSSRFPCIITHGGTSTNVVPAYAACRFRIRAADASYLAEVVQRVIKCAEGGASASGATLRYHECVYPYEHVVPNKTLSKVDNLNLESLGLRVSMQVWQRPSSSTDFGNVSQGVPAVTVRLAIADHEVAGHSREFAEAALSPRGQAGVVAGAKVLAMTAIDLLRDPHLLDAARLEHTAAISISPGRTGIRKG